MVPFLTFCDEAGRFICIFYPAEVTSGAQQQEQQLYHSTIQRSDLKFFALRTSVVWPMSMIIIMCQTY